VRGEEEGGGLGDSMVCLPQAQYASMHSCARIRINGGLLQMPRCQACLCHGGVLKHKPSSERNYSSVPKAGSMSGSPWRKAIVPKAGPISTRIGLGFPSEALGGRQTGR